MKKIIIAIDGYSSCGKSTLAKDLAKALDYTYINTGSMYRATTLYFLDNQVDIHDSEAVHQALNHINITLKPDGKGGSEAFLNGVSVEEKIRTMYVANAVSEVSAISAVRRAMVEQQQKMGEAKAVVLEGRDIGTVVFPNAELKVFMTANIETRTQRRFEELKAKNPDITFEAVQKNLLERDSIDSSRADSPLKKAEDAIVIDNSNLDREGQLQTVLQLAREKINA